jgi:hypothetical protein
VNDWNLVYTRQAHGGDEVSIRTKGRRNFDTALPYSAVDMIATEKTRTAKAAVRATCSPSKGEAEKLTSSVISGIIIGVIPSEQVSSLRPGTADQKGGPLHA